MATADSPRAAPRIAVVGGGLAGLACAGALTRRGASVTVFEQGSVPGGRAATRVTEHGNFDLGAQYFTVQNHKFEAIAAGWQQEGLVKPWPGRMIAFSGGRLIEQAMTHQRHVGVPGMGELGRGLAAGIDIQLSTTIEHVERQGGRWQLHASDRRTLAVRGFDALVVATPSPQAVALLKGQTELIATIAAVQWVPCWAAMVALVRSSGAGFEGAFINDDPILGWVACDSAKPMRERIPGVTERWVLHARPRWSQDYIDMEPEQAGQWMLRAFSARLGRALKPRWLAAHCWRHATPVNPLSQLCLWDARRRVGFAGDWCGGPRLEGAVLSGLALAEAMLE